ncbi:methylated-DNA--[protein]-cysteine S-methyltransferase [Paenibacillus sp. D2_2]|uniref:methylated-DNA--[protein]-cysteine S-methyltransferase n=1 Tax=Paenibacillus sp. D2_2 TaxID=3073092 RepID=UPI00281559A2|nr:methylated-DNA--[protein]-cysteine S-methyltransferase [Paenibacillus sp. D2_2]WMT42166.1 methylated-DNA--[protein]-cysteine S-methyltransferase [Paenibacillus sp. D2_2]
MKQNSHMMVYWSQLSQEDWSIYLAATQQGLCYVGSQNKDFEELSQWVEKHYKEYHLIHNDEILRPYIVELTEYLHGHRQQFSLPIELAGTPFQKEVWDALVAIPYGQTCSYSDIANHIQRPSAVRAVGTAIGANPVLITVPCHRVIGKNGALTGYRGGLEMKTKLLELEQSGSNVQ